MTNKITVLAAGIIAAQSATTLACDGLTFDPNEYHKIESSIGPIAVKGDADEIKAYLMQVDGKSCIEELDVFQSQNELIILKEELILFSGSILDVLNTTINFDKQ